MGINFEYSFEPTNIMEIEAFESKYSISLPEDYKRFLLKNNGGKPSIRRFKTVDGKHTSSLMLLFPLSEDKEFNLISVYKELNIERLIPSNLLSIGNDPIGNEICMSLSGNDRGAVYYWSLDMEDIDEDDYVPSYKHMRLVAKNFTDFINGLLVLEN